MSPPHAIRFCCDPKDIMDAFGNVTDINRFPSVQVGEVENFTSFDKVSSTIELKLLWRYHIKK